MRRGILIALFVAPALAYARPHKAPKKKAATPAKTDTPAEPAKTDTPAEPAKTDTPATDATVPAGGLGGTHGTQSSGTTPTVPATTPVSTPPTGTTGTTGATGTGTGTGTGSGAPTSEPPKTDKDETSDMDVDTLRQEYLSLRDELFKSRARANAVAGQLYSTRMTIKFAWGSARYYGVSKASIRLDGATVYEDATGSIATDDGVRFDGYVAPGKHLVTFHVEATGKDDDSFTSSTESQVVIKAVANKDLLISAKGHDSGDIAYAWKRSEKGSYGLGIDVGVKTVASGTAAAKGKK